METNENFLLPKPWFILIDDDNREVINNWKIKQSYKDNLYETFYNIVHCNGSGDWIEKYDIKRYEISKRRITFEQFQKYVLGIEIEKKEIINENYNYLIAIFKKLNIK